MKAVVHRGRACKNCATVWKRKNGSCHRCHLHRVRVRERGVGAAAKRERNRRWYRANKHWFLSRNAKRNRALTSTLGFDKQVRAIYKACPRGKVVDHIVPLKGLNKDRQHVVCGLHVPWNLEYTTKAANARKWAWMED